MSPIDGAVVGYVTEGDAALAAEAVVTTELACASLTQSRRVGDER